MLMTRQEKAKFRIGELVYYKIGGTLKPDNKEYGIVRMCKIMAVQCHVGNEWVYVLECPEYTSTVNNEVYLKTNTVMAKEKQLSAI